jgi:hypothetical protein
MEKENKNGLGPINVKFSDKITGKFNLNFNHLNDWLSVS